MSAWSFILIIRMDGHGGQCALAMLPDMVRLRMGRRGWGERGGGGVRMCLILREAAKGQSEHDGGSRGGGELRSGAGQSWEGIRDLLL